MKHILSFLMALLLAGPAFAQQNISTYLDSTFYHHVDALLGANVHNGSISYANIKADPAGLNKLVDQVASFDWTKLSPNDQQAFLINAYNILVIQSVVNRYPIKSPLKVAGFFDKAKHTVNGQSLTLNQLEKKILFPKFKDARFHFVLVCAAAGCPVITNTAYRGNKLDKQLNAQTRQALNSTVHVRPNADKSRVDVSELFKWYKSDFTKAGTSVIGFINQYRDEDIPESYKIGYLSYDWRLNDTVKKKR